MILYNNPLGPGQLFTGRQAQIVLICDVHTRCSDHQTNWQPIASQSEIIEVQETLSEPAAKCQNGGPNLSVLCLFRCTTK